MSVVAGRRTITSTPVKISGVETDNSAGHSIAVKNIGSDIVYIGGSSTVSSLTGWALASGESISLDGLFNGEELWAVCATSITSTISTFESGL